MRRFTKYGNAIYLNIREHRRQIVEKVGDPKGEIAQLQNVFDVDNKNYHGWGYRYKFVDNKSIWLCEHFNLYKSELA